MEKATVSEVKNRLSAYLRKVRAGKTVLVLDRGRPVARIEPVAPADRSDDERLAELERQGLIKRGRGNPLEALRRLPLPKSEKSVVEALIEERREGR
jgi:prevent-host-death family protein